MLLTDEKLAPAPRALARTTRDSLRGDDRDTDGAGTATEVGAAADGIATSPGVATRGGGQRRVSPRVQRLVEILAAGVRVLVVRDHLPLSPEAIEERARGLAQAVIGWEEEYGRGA